MVDSADGLSGIKDLLQEDSICGGLPVGLDTEWDDTSALCTLQLALLKKPYHLGLYHAWVIDMIPVHCGADLEYANTVKTIIRCLFQKPHICLVGFDLRHDLDRLHKLVPDLEPSL